MSHHENLTKHNQQVSKRALLKRTLKVVSELAFGDVSVAERAVHFTHQAQMSNGPALAFENLRIVTGRPVDTFSTSVEIDLGGWKEGGKVGEYHRSDNGDTFAYTEIIEGRGSQRLPEAVTHAFTSRSRAELIRSFGKPVNPDDGKIVQFPELEELRATS